MLLLPSHVVLTIILHPTVLALVRAPEERSPIPFRLVSNTSSPDLPICFPVGQVYTP